MEKAIDDEDNLHRDFQFEARRVRVVTSAGTKYEKETLKCAVKKLGRKFQLR